MPFNIGLGKRRVLGLDIGSSLIKAVELREHKTGYELQFFDSYPLPHDVIVDGAIMDSIRLSETLREFFEKKKIKTKDVAIALAGHSSVMVKRIVLPEMSEEELSESIRFEAEQYIPFPIDEVNIDFQILGPRPEAGQMDVAIVAAKKDAVNEYVSVLKETGLNPVVVDVAAFALSNMYELNYEIEPNRVVALFNIGASTINMCVVVGGLPVLARDSSAGTNMITEALQREFHLSYEDAELLKKGVSLQTVSIEDAEPVIMSGAEEIFAEVIRAVEYYRTQGGEDVHEVILSGGAALMKNFSQALSDRLGIEVRTAEPFRNIKIPKKFDPIFIDEIGPVAAVAVGLAVRRPGDR
ncbi:MAG: pilus assembly protein PilM [Thermodesulfovibrionales bacterium]|nr:pilus assembly protein PilM [Thermodesulfovibrionales bacterium]